MELKYVLDYMKHTREMEKQGKGPQANVGFLKGLIDRKTEDIIATQKGELSAYDKIKIKRKVKADLKKSISRVGLTLAAIGIAAGIGVKARNALTEGKYNGVEVIETGVDVASISDHDFNKSLKVDVNDLEEIQSSDKQLAGLKATAKEMVESFKNSEQKLNDLKEMYLEKYNSKNHTNYTVEDIEIEKTRQGMEFYEDEAENGDAIVRVRQAENWQENSNMGLLRVFIDDNLVEKGTIFQNEYKNVYSEDEVVPADKETNIMGKVISTGIDFLTGLDHEEQNSMEVMQTYEERFESSIVEYKQNEISQIIENDIDERE